MDACGGYGELNLRRTLLLLLLNVDCDPLAAVLSFSTYDDPDLFSLVLFISGT